MIYKYIKAIENGDCVALASCFNEKCKYFDYCSTTGFHIYGRCAMEMFFRNKFAFRQFKIYDFVSENDTHANFFVAYGNTYFHVRATIEEFDENGLIKEMTIRHA